MLMAETVEPIIIIIIVSEKYKEINGMERRAGHLRGGREVGRLEGGLEA